MIGHPYPDNLEFDFEAEVHFHKRTPEGEGRGTPPCNGYRADFGYEGESKSNLWTVWPLQFFTEEGDVPDGQPAPWDCFARFHILNRELRESVHRHRLQPGVRFSILEGSKVVAHGTVTRLLSLGVGPEPRQTSEP